jgi:tetratricopeptide (TPR) repeat protein
MAKMEDDASAAADPNHALLVDVNALVQSGDITRATEMARAALARGIVHPLLLDLRAFWLEQNNRVREAAADLERAVAMAPNDAALRNTLGLCLTKLGRWEDAVTQFEASVSLAPSWASCFNLASARECNGDLKGARADFERALELAPGNPEPLASLANLAARGGDWSEAIAFAESALAADPKQYLALVTLANCSVATGNLPNAGALIDSILADPALPQVNRTMLLTLRGDLRHAEGRYAEAFDAYSQANALRRTLFADIYAAPRQETAASYAQWLGDYFEAAPGAMWSVANRPAPKGAHRGPAVRSHVFLLGFARSGTTLLENILASHPDFVALGEKEVLVESFSEYLSNDKGADRLAAADEATLDKFRDAYWRRVAHYCKDDIAGKLFVDKRPLATVKLALVAKLFPDAKILFAVRDPRDVVLSCFRRQFLLNPSMFEFLELRNAARYYSLVMRLAAISREKFAQPWFETRHEALIEDFDVEIQKIFDFLGVEWSDGVRGFAENAKHRFITTPSSTQVIKGLSREGAGQWRHYREQLAPVLPVLRPWIEKFGYTPY